MRDKTQTKSQGNLKVASASLPGSSGSVQPRTRPRARGLRGSAEGRPCRSVFPSAVRNFRTFRPEAFDAVLRPQNLTREVSAGVWRGRRPSRSDLPSRGVDGRRAYLVTSGSRAKPGTIVRGRYTFRWSIRGRRMVSCTRPLAQEHIRSGPGGISRPAPDPRQPIASSRGGAAPPAGAANPCF